MWGGTWSSKEVKKGNKSRLAKVIDATIFSGRFSRIRDNSNKESVESFQSQNETYVVNKGLINGQS
jgi:hypothetical protein